MPRQPIATPERIRDAVISMLRNAGEPAPATSERFRQIVSVRKVRALIGGGDQAAVSRQISAIELEVVQGGLEPFPLPDLPADVADLMRTLWKAAISVQIDEVVRLRREAREAVAEAEQKSIDDRLRADALDEEIKTLRATLTARDDELADLRADNATLRQRNSGLQSAAQTYQQQLEAAATERTELVRQHGQELEEVRLRFEGLSKRLLQETDRQREQAQKDAERAAGLLAIASARVAELESGLARQATDLAEEKDKRQRAESAADALRTVNIAQGDQIETLKRAAAAADNVHRAAGASLRPTGGRRIKSLQKNRLLRRGPTT